MKIGYLNGQRLYTAFLAGGDAVIQDQDYLNKINVFPVPDADTGTNLAATMRSIAETAVVSRSLKATFRSIADAALAGARGNSGLIFAQFLHSLSDEIPQEPRLTTRSFAAAARRAVHSLHKAIMSPTEGTMLTVMREWADSLHQHAPRTADFVELLARSLHAARQSLMNTPKRLSVLARAGVVDAGAKGFVDFIEGVHSFTRAGKLRKIPQAKPLPAQFEPKVHSFKRPVTHRYCTEALLQGEGLDIERIRGLVCSSGDSAIVAGSVEKIRFHVHTDAPAELFDRLGEADEIIQVKVDDMRRQFEASHSRKWPVAIVTDSSCDLPRELLDEHQVHIIPFNLSFGHRLFIDKLTITSDRFYTMLGSSQVQPQTSQPPLASVRSALAFLLSHYESAIVFHISEKLSGTCGFSRQAARTIEGKKISVINSKNISLSLGLIVRRAAEALARGATHDEIVAESEAWIAKIKVWIDVRTTKYLVRGGRLSPMKGLLARLLHLKPLIILDDEGRAVPAGKSFTRDGNMKKIIRQAEKMAAQGKLWDYAVVHAHDQSRALAYAKVLEARLGRPPAFVMDVSPVIGVHVGPGGVGVAVMLE
jgi:DegV family protein with EDD domain